MTYGDFPYKMPTSSFGNGLADELERVLFEAHALSIQLRQAKRRLHVDFPADTRAVLQALKQFGSMTVPQLARRRSTSRQNIQMIANRLETLGLIEFVENADHKRSNLMRVTEQGEQFLSQAVSREAQLLANLLTHTTESEILSSAKLLAKLRRLLSGHPLREDASTQIDARSGTAKRSSETDRTTRKVASPSQDRHEVPPESSDDELPVNLL